MSHELAPPLTNLLYAMAEEGAGDWATGPGGNVWTGLRRDGPEIARRLGEQIEANDASRETRSTLRTGLP
jgi:hypothetical protein